MKKLLLIFAVLCLLLSSCSSAVFAAYPEKHINLVTYVGAGGGMDVSCRKFVQIAARYTDATIVVENRTAAVPSLRWPSRRTRGCTDFSAT